MTLVAVALIILAMVLCVIMAINEARRKRTETPKLDAMIFRKEGDESE